MAEFGPNSLLSDDGCQPVQPAVNWVTMGLLLLPWARQQSTVTCWCFPGSPPGEREGNLEPTCPRLWHFCGSPGLKGAVAVLICVPALTICIVSEFHGTCRAMLSKLAI